MKYNHICFTTATDSWVVDINNFNSWQTEKNIFKNTKINEGDLLKYHHIRYIDSKIEFDSTFADTIPLQLCKRAIINWDKESTFDNQLSITTDTVTSVLIAKCMYQKVEHLQSLLKEHKASIVPY
jgi:hypothetical protein